MSNKLPLVSVLIPAYNHEKYVKETIASIIAQTYQPIELIMIDDGSKDGTFAKMQEMKPACEKRFARVEMHTQSNAGTCETLNRLFKLAQGEYIYLIASDDMAKPEAIEKEVAFLSAHADYVLAVGDNDLIDGDSTPIGWDQDRHSTTLQHAKYKTFGAFLKQIRSDVDFSTDTFGRYDTPALGNYIPNGYLISAQAWKQIPPFTKEAPLEDWFLMLQLAKLGKFKYLDKILFSYRWHSENTVCHLTRMNTITHHTRLYEAGLVARLGDKERKRQFDHANTKINVKCSLGNWLSYYSKTDIYSKRYILECFGKKWTLKRMPYREGML